MFASEGGELGLRAVWHAAPPPLSRLDSSHPGPLASLTPRPFGGIEALPPPFVVSRAPIPRALSLFVPAAWLHIPLAVVLPSSHDVRHSGRLSRLDTGGGRLTIASVIRAAASSAAAESAHRMLQPVPKQQTRSKWKAGLMRVMPLKMEVKKSRISKIGGADVSDRRAAVDRDGRAGSGTVMRGRPQHHH